MVEERPTPTIEDYLGVVYTLERDGEAVIGARLAEWLEVSPPTVTATVKRMVRDGWVIMDGSKEIRLTPSGRAAAQSVLRRHMLAELLLARMLGVPWSQVHQEADAMEHTISSETVEYCFIAWRIALTLVLQAACLPSTTARIIPGTTSVTSMEIIIMTISSSTRVNPFSFLNELKK